MSLSITGDQFERALNLSIQRARKKWQHSTDMIIAHVIAGSQEKDETMEILEAFMKEAQTEEEFLRLIKEQFPTALPTTEAQK